MTEEQAIIQMPFDEFLEGQSKADFNPMLEFDAYPVTLMDKIILASKKSYNNFFSYTCWDNKLKQFVKHTYAVRRHNIKGQFSLDIKEVRRDFETYPTIIRDLYYQEYGCARGCHVIWNKKRATYYMDAMAPNEEWYQMDESFHEKMAYYTYEINFIQDIIIHDMSLRYMGYNDNQSDIDLLDYIKLYRKEPIVETFMKLGLYRFIKSEKAIKTANENKAFRKWLYKNYTACQRKAFITCYNSFKKNPNNSVQNYYDSLMYRIECGKELSKAGKKIYEYVLKFTTREKMRDYIEENNIGANSYFDYLEACRWLQLNFNDTKVLFPKDFQTYHDDYTKQYGDWKLEQAKEKAAKESAEISSKMGQIATKFDFCNFKGQLYVVIVAKSKIELIEEGSKLEHCVGRMSYDQKQAKGESLICFLRKAEEIETPYVTMQLDLKTFQVLQCYGHHDSKPSDDVMDFVNNTWLPTIKKLRKDGARACQ